MPNLSLTNLTSQTDNLPQNIMNFLKCNFSELSNRLDSMDFSLKLFYNALDIELLSILEQYPFIY
jgi:hypothetical protein